MNSAPSSASHTDLSIWSSIWSASKKALAQPAFAVLAVVLLVAAVGLNGATQALQLHFKKIPVPLARPLDQIQTNLGHWTQVSKDEPLDKEIQDVLGTQQFIFRDYVNTQRIGKDEIAKFEGKSYKERRELLSKLQGRYPDAVMNCAVTYYTGMVDTVAHIPDRCYIADGFQPTEYTEPYWKVGGRDHQVRFINFEDQTGSSRVPRSVAYFFQVNGRYEADPLAVRRSLQNLFRKHGYYAKVELMTILPDTAKSAEVMTDFLNAGLPEIEKCFPDWQAVEFTKK